MYVFTRLFGNGKPSYGEDQEKIFFPNLTEFLNFYQTQVTVWKKQTAINYAFPDIRDIKPFFLQAGQIYGRVRDVFHGKLRPRESVHHVVEISATFEQTPRLCFVHKSYVTTQPDKQVIEFFDRNYRPFTLQF